MRDFQHHQDLAVLEVQEVQEGQAGLVAEAHPLREGDQVLAGLPLLERNRPGNPLPHLRLKTTAFIHLHTNYLALDLSHRKECNYLSST